MPVSDAITFSEGSWLRSLVNGERRPNVLVLADGPRAASVAATIASLCHGPVDSCVLPGAFHLPHPGPTTLLLHDASKLTLPQQIALQDWLNNRVTRAQVIAVTSIPVLPLVNEGLFLESLYYRLNAVYLVAELGRDPEE
jgi:hypothetical protein